MKTAVWLFATFAPGFCALLAQGPLTPPGAPAPAMKTLEQTEPRKEINAANTPGDADSGFKIAQPGSYFLTGNLTGVHCCGGARFAPFPLPRFDFVHQ